MKKIIAAVVALISMSAFDLQAQQYFQPGDNYINVGVGFASSYSYSGYGTLTGLPTLALSFDRGFKKIGPGVLGLGGGIQHRARKSFRTVQGTEYKSSWVYTDFAVRGTYHPDIFEIDKIDWYGGVNVGFRVVTYKDAYGESIGAYRKSAYPSRPFVNPFVGGRYFFTNSISAYSEVGYDALAFIKAGISFKF